MMYLLLSVAGHLTIFQTRTRGAWWTVRPARILLGAVVGTQVVATCICLFGFLVTPLWWGWAALVWGYAPGLVPHHRPDQAPRLSLSRRHEAGRAEAAGRVSRGCAQDGGRDASRRRIDERTTAAPAAERIAMKIEAKDFRVREGDKVNLEKWPTKVDPVYKSKDQYKTLLEEHVAKLGSPAAAPLGFQPARSAADPSGDRRRGQGRRDPPRDVGRQSAGLPRLQFQTTYRRSNSSTISSGEPRATCPSAGGSRSSTDPITRKCSWFACTRTFSSARPSPTRRDTTRRSGASAIARSTISSGISTSTGPASSKSSCICPRRSSASGFSTASTILRRTGNSATRI